MFSFQAESMTQNKNLEQICVTASFLGQPCYASTRKVKPFWILMKQETMGSVSAGPYSIIYLAIDQTDNHASTLSLNFYRLDAVPDA